ncbi:glutamate synthase subunit beta [Magnetococcales bacterium HHB-1]
MGKITGFIEIEREVPQTRPVAERIQDWDELYQEFPLERLRQQAARCMDCGVPFCHNGCNLHNLIPVWNHWAYQGRWKEALDVLHSTNNFPEFTGRVCPALCEASCVVGLNREPVTIRQIEQTIIEEGFKRNLVHPFEVTEKSGKKVAVVGSGPAGMAASQQLVRAGHEVTLFEKNEAVGGLLRYGIPDFKLEKKIIDRRLEQMVNEGLTIKTGVHIGIDLPITQLRDTFDAIVLAGGAENPRDLPVAGRDLRGIHFAMDYLAQQNRRVAGIQIPEEKAISAKGKKVIVIGGGDTGSDCVGTALRQGAERVTQIELLSKPPKDRSPDTPWPLWPHMLRTSSSHQEGCERLWSVLTQSFEGEKSQVKRLHCIRVQWKEPENENKHMEMEKIPGSNFTQEADLVLLAMGFLGPVQRGMLEALDLKLDNRGNVMIDQNSMTSEAGVFAAGDMATGQSLVLRAIQGGRQAATGVDNWLKQQK